MGEPLLNGYTEHAKTIPLMLGTVYGEFSFPPLPFNKQELIDQKMKVIIAEKFGEQSEEIIDLFLKAYPYPDKKIVDLLSLDRVFREPTKALAQLHAVAGKTPAYLYNFTLDFPYEHGKTAWHCADIPFVFHNTDKVEVCNIPGVSDKLEKQVFNAFVGFARNGNPNHDDLPNWPAVTVENEPTMIFDQICEVRENYDHALLALLDEVLSPLSLEELFQQDIQH